MKMRCRNFRPDITLTCATSNRSMPSLQPRHLPSPLTPTHAILTLIPCDNWQFLFFFFWAETIAFIWINLIYNLRKDSWYISSFSNPASLSTVYIDSYFLLQHSNPNEVTELKLNYWSVVATQILLLTWSAEETQESKEKLSLFL